MYKNLSVKENPSWFSRYMYVIQYYSFIRLIYENEQTLL